MTVKELYDYSLKNFENKMDLDKLPQIYKSILEESCENALNNKQGVTDKDELKYAVHVAFMTALSALRGMVKGLLHNTDQVTINYRNGTHVITKDSPLLIE